MIQATGSLLLALSLLMIAAAPLSAVEAGTRHSGTVVMIDAQRGVMVMNEVGPWRVEKGQTVVTRLTIALTPDTKVNKFIRVNAPGAFAGDFIEVEFETTDMWAGDFVTVECVHEANRLVAVAVTVAELN